VSLRVAFDAGPLLDPPTGVGRYARELSHSLSEVGVDVRPYAVALRGSSEGSINRMRLPARLVHRAWLRSGRPSADRLVGDVDVVHGTNFVLPPTKTPGVVTVHDLSFLRDDAFPGAAAWARMVPWSIERAERVLTITDQVAGEIVDHYGVDRSKIVVTHLGVSPAFFGAAPLSDASLHRLGIARPFVLAAGTLEPRKNLPRLLAAWDSLGDEKDGWSLVLAGPKGWGPGLPRTEGVVLTGWVGDETLPGLLAAADVFAFPSLYEGFGLPPLEAMATGTACVAGTYSAAEEVLGDAAVMVDPLDPAAIAGGLSMLMNDEGARRSYALSGKARAAAFTWERTARSTIEAYEQASRAR
jgi:glycosyltransferase involved in cell wall biosynthesis